MDVLIGIGTNLGNRIANLKQCQELFEFLHDVKTSSIYESPALLPENAKASWDLPFLNMAIHAQTDLKPLELLKVIKEIENNLGRPKNYDKWSPRIIDIDILLMDICFEHNDLTIPHPELLNRAFALVPCQEIAPNFEHPILKQKLKDIAIDKSNLKLISKFQS